VKAIINGRVYNTDTADLVCETYRGYSGDFHWDETGLYRTKKGTFFLAGQGGPKSRWAETDGRHWNTGSGIRLVGWDEARCFMEEAACSEEVYQALGISVTEG
jgi:hypothetical protein